MTSYNNYEGKVCKVTLFKNNCFFVLDPDHFPISDYYLRECVWKEIEYWELKNTHTSFDFIYTIENRDNPEVLFIRHEHEFERIRSNLNPVRIKSKLFSAGYYQVYENFHKCNVCGLIYKTQIIRLMEKK